MGCFAIATAPASCTALAFSTKLTSPRWTTATRPASAAAFAGTTGMFVTVGREQGRATVSTAAAAECHRSSSTKIEVTRALWASGGGGAPGSPTVNGSTRTASAPSTCPERTNRVLSSAVSQRHVCVCEWR